MTWRSETRLNKRKFPSWSGSWPTWRANPQLPCPALKERTCIEIDRDNFNTILEGMRPRLAFKVANRIQENDTRIGVDLTFGSLDDFHPASIARQVAPIRKLVEARRKLYNLLGKLDGNDALEALLQDVVTNTDKLELIAKHAPGDRRDDPHSDRQTD